MISVWGNKKCCGCSACHDICPVNAIQMKADREGFLYPVVDEEKCTKCGICEKVCPAMEQPEFNGEPEMYAVQLKDIAALNRSQSGGGFWAIAKPVLDDGGIVYGAGFDENLRVVYKRADTPEKAQEFHGSKYVQADATGIFSQAKEDLKAGKKVLFTGTSCHISGLYKYLGKEYENLLTCDLICHGVPTPMLLQKYIEYIESREKTEVKKFYFGYYNADEGYNWNDPRREMIVSDKKSFQEKKYISMFASNWCLRPYCHTCPHTKTERVADFTLGDCWGAETFTNGFDYNRGVSVVFLNSEKAKEHFEKTKETVISEPVAAENVKKYQHNLRLPSSPNKRRDKIINVLIEKDFISAYKKDRFYYNLYCLKQKVLKR